MPDKESGILIKEQLQGRGGVAGALGHKDLPVIDRPQTNTPTRTQPLYRRRESEGGIDAGPFQFVPSQLNQRDRLVAL